MNARSRTPRRTLTLGTLLVASVLLSGCGALSTLATTSIPDGEVDAFSIVVGDCLNDATVSDEVTTLPFVDCSQPHDSEVFARTEVVGDTFPGNEQLETQLTEFCRGDAFTDFVGTAYRDSMYDTSGYFPSTQSWASGDRELLCTVWDPEGQVTGTLAGIAR